MSQLEVDKIIPQSGTTLTIGDSGDTVTVASGATLTGDLNADNLTSGTVPSARISGSYTGITQTGTLTNSSAPVSIFNRTTSDGPIIDLRKDGTVVGDISSNNGSIELNSQGSSLKFSHLGTNVGFITSNAFGAYADNAMNLGSSGSRFKDLYLGGGLYVGGTGTANKLDDYEEGTWTPRLTNETTAVYSDQTGWYRKIGNTVYIYFSIQLTNKGDISGSYTRIGSLPFNGSPNTKFGSGQITRYRTSSSAHIQGIEFGGGVVTAGWITTGGGTQNGYLNTSLVVDNSRFEGFAMYKTA